MTNERSLWPWERSGREEIFDDANRDELSLEWRERLLILERELATLKEEVRRLRHQKVEYRIDQLHIESLEGILNIGLSTTADEEQLEALQAAQGQSTLKGAGDTPATQDQNVDTGPDRPEPA
ncbi:MAG: spore germination protein GerPC [Firmicutes bacterium]|nr:spore germination protein GerPC [Bacillota bacterium]